MRRKSLLHSIWQSNVVSYTAMYVIESTALSCKLAVMAMVRFGGGAAAMQRR